MSVKIDFANGLRSSVVELKRQRAEKFTHRTTKKAILFGALMGLSALFLYYLGGGVQPTWLVVLGFSVGITLQEFTTVRWSADAADKYRLLYLDQQIRDAEFMITQHELIYELAENLRKLKKEEDDVPAAEDN